MCYIPELRLDPQSEDKVLSVYSKNVDHVRKIENTYCFVFFRTMSVEFDVRYRRNRPLSGLASKSHLASTMIDNLDV
jgi:hypothetical protein